MLPLSSLYPSTCVSLFPLPLSPKACGGYRQAKGNLEFVTVFTLFTDNFKNVIVLQNQTWPPLSFYDEKVSLTDKDICFLKPRNQNAVGIFIIM